MRLRKAAALVLLLTLRPLAALAWGPTGHHLIASIATDHLTPTARSNVSALLGEETLADVASWADAYRPDETQTAGWHYTDIPADQKTYVRDRDCPVQPGVTAGSPADKLRDCSVDRILFFEQRLKDLTLDPADRAIALKYLVHFVGDSHQPFHASGVARGGNGIQVVVFGQADCNGRPCNLHAVWDSGLIAHRNLTESAYLAVLEDEIKQKNVLAGTLDPAAWTGDAKVLSDAALLPNGGAVDEAYYTRELPVVDQQMELAGLRLAAILNATFTAAPLDKWRPAPPAPPTPPAAAAPAQP